MDEIGIKSIIKELGIFAGLPESDQEIISRYSDIVEFRKGQIIYREKDPADAFYCIILGRVVIENTDSAGNVRILEYLHRGKYFGIISLLTGELHSVTARALNDSVLLKISKENFQSILIKVPQFAIDLSRTLSRRLKDKDIHQKTIFESTIISVSSCIGCSGKTLYAVNLAFGLKIQTAKAVIVIEVIAKGKAPTLQKIFCPEAMIFSSAHSLEHLPSFINKSKSGIDFLFLTYSSGDESELKRFLEVLTFLVNDYHYLILDLSNPYDAFAWEMLVQSDDVHILAIRDNTNLIRTKELIERLKKEANLQDGQIKVIINDGADDFVVNRNYVDRMPIFATLPKVETSNPYTAVVDFPDSLFAKAIRRISRHIGERLVGLALGVGAAYGFCHIGVLKVLEEENIPIDIISGSSIGAVIASFWAIGKKSAEILDLVSELSEKKGIWSFSDLSFSSLGLIKGKRLYNFLQRHLGNKTFYDIKIPLKIIASDIIKKEARVLDKGSLVEAIMASCSMPGVVRPLPFQGEFLFDGGVTCPLPTEILFQMGTNKIIAVNVTPSREDALKEFFKLKEQVEQEEEKYKKRAIFKGYFSRRFKSNILDIIFSSVELMQSELVKKEASLADVVLHPNTAGLHWMEFHKARIFAQRGEEEARENIAKIWEVVKQ